jgi:hemolysin III
MAIIYRDQDRREEILNVVIHGFGLALAIVATPFLITRALHHTNVMMVWGVAVFSLGMIGVYLSSTIYHALTNPVLKRRANIIDHISIYFLIGGTYTPIILHYTNKETATIFLTIQWGIILIALVLKLFFTGKYESLSVALYITLGWMLIFVIRQIFEHMPMEIFYWIIAGGISYTLGVIFYTMHSKKHAHNIWHCFVLGGTILHFIAIYKSLT